MRHNKLQRSGVSADADSQQYLGGQDDGKGQRKRCFLRTFWIRFTRASPLLSRRFQRASVSLKCAEFVRMRLVRLVAIILREI